MARRWQRRPEGSNWGEFGDDDQFGRLNLLTPEKVKQGVAEVREGLSFCLSLPLDLPGGNVLNPRRHPPQLEANEGDGWPLINFPAARRDPAHTDVLCDDRVLLWTQYSTQWDALCHVGQRFDADGDGIAEPVYYNGFRGGEHVVGPLDYERNETPTGRDYRGVAALGIQNYAEKPIQGRAVLLDLRAHFGDQRRKVDFDDLSAVMAADEVAIETGDMLCLHTGFADRILAMAGEPDPEVLHGACAVLEARDRRLLDWVRDSGIAAICADNYAVEAHPSTPGKGECFAGLPLHELCLFKLGIPLGELWYFSELAGWLRENRRSRFLLTAPALRLPGAVGSPLTPVGTV